MKINLKKCTEEELWKFVAVHLKKRGIDSVLVGGAVVSIYSEGEYQSGDLDFVKTSFLVENLDESMNEIGFIKENRHYIHPKCKHLFVEFPGGPPLGIGEDYSIKPDEVKVEGTVIKILSPTDCVKDRLATYIYFKDREGLEQAVLVAKRQEINTRRVKKWCHDEGYPEVYNEFIQEIKIKK